MKVKLIFLLSFLFVTPSAGCSASHWLGVEDVNDSITASKGLFGSSFTVQTRKDTAHKLDVEKVEWDRELGTFTLSGLHSDYNGRATDVINADSQRALAVGQAQLSQAAYVDSVGRLLKDLADSVGKGLLSVGEARAMAIRAGVSPLEAGASISFPGGGGASIGGTRPTTPVTTQPAQ
jgi:hypothetical protein